MFTHIVTHSFKDTIIDYYLLSNLIGQSLLSLLISLTVFGKKIKESNPTWSCFSHLPSVVYSCYGYVSKDSSINLATVEIKSWGILPRELTWDKFYWWTAWIRRLSYNEISSDIYFDPFCVFTVLYRFTLLFT